MGRTRHVEVAIVGGGTAGLGALGEVRKHTDNFVIINDGPWGTMCARVGCMPSKALLEAANAFHRARDFAELGVAGADHLTVDMRAVLTRVREVRDVFVNETLQHTRLLGDRAISGRARLDGLQRIVVGGEEIRADRIVLATGSSPTVPKAWRAWSDRVLTSDSLFEQESLPKRIAVLGLGAVGAELAQALARLGHEVTAFEATPSVAGITDPEILDCFLGALHSDLAIHLGHEAEVSPERTGLRVSAGAVSAVVDRVLVALGRKPNLEGLGLETLDFPRHEDGLPKVDPATLQLGDLPVFLAGDAGSPPFIQHEASDDGHIAGRNACHREVRSYARRVPLSIAFTSPEVARVGVSWSKLERRSVTIGEASYEHQGRARIAIQKVGRLRIYAETASGLILGAEIVAPGGEHLAHLLALAIERKCTASDLLRTPFYHPCLEESVRTALREIVTARHEGADMSELGLASA